MTETPLTSPERMDSYHASMRHFFYLLSRQQTLAARAFVPMKLDIHLS